MSEDGPSRQDDIQIRMTPSGEQWRLRAEVSRIAFLALSLLLGLAYAFVVLGPRPLNPFNLSWLVSDPATAYLGWAFFRQETHLTLPLGWSHAIGYPLGEPVAYFDAIPLVAMVCWLFRNLIPEGFQYFGIYFSVCATLQFYFGYRISRRICGDDPVAGLLGGALFLISPTFTWRALGHFALASHWVLLAGLDQLLRTTGRLSPGEVLWSAAICFIAGSINPYIAAMLLLIACATYARPLISEKKSLRWSLLGFSVAVCSTVLGFALFGFLRTTDLSQYTAGGFELYSMNLLAPIDPEVYGGLILKQQPIAPGQYEGYNYLGLGFLLLGTVAIVRTPSSVYYLLRGKMVPVLAIFVVSLLLALSTKATFGDHVLYQIALPEPIWQVLTSFHSPGRLFWPGYYLIFSAVIASAFNAFRGRRLHVALTAALIIQLLDLAPLRAAVRQNWQAAVAAAVPAGTPWRDLGQTQRHLVIVPPWQCSPADTPGDMNGYAIFGRLALQQHMTINSFYAARYSDVQRKFFCDDQIAQMRQEGLREDTAYVFGKSVAGQLVELEYRGNYCRHEDRYILCSRVPGRSGLDPEVLQDVELLSSGEVVSFAGPNKAADHLIGWGWSVPESWGRWMLGHTANLIFRVPEQSRDDIRIDLSVVPFVPAKHPHQKLELFANHVLVLQQTFGPGGPFDLRISIPRRVIGPDGVVKLNLNSIDPVSPETLGLSGDERELSIGIARLRIENADD